MLCKIKNPDRKSVGVLLSYRFVSEFLAKKLEIFFLLFNLVCF